MAADPTDAMSHDGATVARVLHIVTANASPDLTTVRDASLIFQQVDDPMHRAMAALVNALITELSHAATPAVIHGLHLVATTVVAALPFP